MRFRDVFAMGVVVGVLFALFQINIPVFAVGVMVTIIAALAIGLRVRSKRRPVSPSPTD